MDKFVKEMSALKINSFENNTDSLHFGKTTATPHIPSFTGEIVIMEYRFSPNPLDINKCDGGEIHREANATDNLVEISFSTFKIESYRILQGLADLCKVPTTSILLNFDGTYDAHDQTCEILYGGLQHSISSPPDFWENSSSQCGESDGPLLWVNTPPTMNSEDLNATCFMMYKNMKTSLTSCHMVFNCSICVTYQNMEVFLFGLVQFLDRRYTVQSDSSGNLMFSGSHSKMVKENEIWMLKSNVSQNILIYDKSMLPLGRKEWKAVNCSDCYDKHVTLTFSLCLQDEFCCSNGQCITGQGARCNGIVQCSDASDEFNCTHIVEDQGYQRKQIPSEKEIHGKELAEVFHLGYAFNMKYISDIFSIDGKLSLDFEMSARWSDHRLTLKNLNSNGILDADIWQPEFMYFATVSDGDAIAPHSEERTLSANTIDSRTLAPNFNDSYMGKSVKNPIYLVKRP